MCSLATLQLLFDKSQLIVSENDLECVVQTARQTTRILGVHLEGKFQMALLKFKSANEADAFAKHVQEHRPKA